jgi:hypothetical protein
VWKYVSNQAANELNSFLSTVKPPMFIRLTFLRFSSLWDSQVCDAWHGYVFCCIFIAYVLFVSCVCVCLFYIYLAYVRYFVFIGFNVIMFKCLVSWIVYFSCHHNHHHHHHHHHISNVLVWLPFCKLENHSEIDT